MIFIVGFLFVCGMATAVACMAAYLKLNGAMD
jgi:hypothetical protein